MPLPSSTVFLYAWKVDPEDAQFDPAVTITFRVPEDEWRPDNQIRCMQFIGEWNSLPVIPDGGVQSFSAALSRSGIIALVSEVPPGSSDTPLQAEHFRDCCCRRGAAITDTQSIVDRVRGRLRDYRHFRAVYL
jgi:hypothetical protein